MNARALTGAGLSVLVLGAVGVVGSLVEPPAEVSQPPEVRVEPLAGVSLGCPLPAEVPESETVAAAVALPDPGVETDATAPSALALQTLPGPESAAAELARTDVRGESVTAAVEETPVLAAATGGLAPAVVAEATTTAAGERTAGLASVPCVEPEREWWFLGGDGGVGRRSTLVLANAADGPAVVDVEVWTEDGPLNAAGTNDLGVPARGSRTVSVDAVASGSERVGVHVTASVGKVAAAVVVREVEGADPLGLTWVTPSEPASTLAHVPGVPAFGDRVLRLLNPGEDDSIASLRVLSGQGPFTPVGLEAIDVPALSVVDVDLSAAGEESLALEISATQPVVSSVRATQIPGSGLGDLAIVGSAPTVDGQAATWVSAADGRSTRLVLTALPDEVPRSPTASPTGSPTGSPTASPTGSPTASPTAGADLVDVETPTTTVLVRWLAPDGAVLDEQTATLALGTTDPFPGTLPEGTTEAWLVVEPAEAGRVLAAREATTTVAVPDPLDPDTPRDAFWLDIVALRTARTTVGIPPVLPDITVGLPYPGSE